MRKREGDMRCCIFPYRSLSVPDVSFKAAHRMPCLPSMQPTPTAPTCLQLKARGRERPSRKLSTETTRGIFYLFYYLFLFLFGIFANSPLASPLTSPITPFISLNSFKFLHAWTFDEGV